MTNVLFEFATGSLTLSIDPAQGRLPAHSLTEDAWYALPAESGVPTDSIAELVDCYFDWVDSGDFHRANGAESDDSFYEDQGVLVKNEPLDLIEELGIIKGFSAIILYGGTFDDGSEEGVEVSGILPHLTVWSSDKLNVNSASRISLLTCLDLDEFMIDDLLTFRDGIDGEPGTEDDGFASLTEAGVSKKMFQLTGSIFRVKCVAEVKNARSVIEAVFRLDNSELTPLYWCDGAQQN